MPLFSELNIRYDCKSNAEGHNVGIIGMCESPDCFYLKKIEDVFDSGGKFDIGLFGGV